MITKINNEIFGAPDLSDSNSDIETNKYQVIKNLDIEQNVEAIKI